MNNRIKIIQEAWNSYKEDAKFTEPTFLLESVGYLLGELNKLSMNEYQSEAAKTIIYPREHAIDYCTMKLASEAGEVAGKVAKRWRDDAGKMTPERANGIKRELGDVLWYVAVLALELGFSLEYIAKENIGDLKDRKVRGVLKGDGDNR